MPSSQMNKIGIFVIRELGCKFRSTRSWGRSASFETPAEGRAPRAFEVLL